MRVDGLPGVSALPGSLVVPLTVLVRLREGLVAALEVCTPGAEVPDAEVPDDADPASSPDGWHPWRIDAEALFAVTSELNLSGIAIRLGATSGLSR